MNVGSVLQNHARFRPNQPAIVVGAHRLSFFQFNARVNRLANALASNGVGLGDKVACVTPNCLEMVELYWATAKLGAVAVPLSTLLTGKSLKSLIEHSDATFAMLSSESAAEFPSGTHNPNIPLSNRIVIGTSPAEGVLYDRFVEGASSEEPEAAPIKPSTPLMIVYSSGTTGEPKGIVLSHYARAMIPKLS